MNELYLMRMHEAILIIYMISVACYFMDFVQKSGQIKRIGYYLLITVFVLQTITICLFVYEAGRLPLQTIGEGFYIYTWLIILLSLMFTYTIKTEFIVFLMNLIGFIFMMIHTFQPVNFTDDTTVSHMMNELLVIHVGMAIMAYVMFLVAFLHSVLFLLQMYYLKKKKFTQKFFRISDLPQMSQFVYLFSTIGFLMLLISLILGIYWGIIFVGSSIWLDTKVIGSLMLLIVYGIFIYLYYKKKLKMNIMMELNIILFLLMMINYLVISRFSNFHQLFY